eukprot:CAMPEP_0173252528 /NCGR_PEP_ID=MMETSP1142-20121109/20784_1 /TAXON_ID=483371 /ORGANISM="non described non described, Strain CCMP2298" /LENGTH=101 /DNA_ID=CAMNT_0014185595 /DNA_START=71 /DNA_END=373 /DNA_ORIENTATION=+
MRKAGSSLLPTDVEALKERHMFVRDDDYDEAHGDDWKVRLARRYYDKLYKEFAIADLSRYKEGQVGFRWRTEEEVVARKGQAVCGSSVCSSEEWGEGLSVY